MRGRVARSESVAGSHSGPALRSWEKFCSWGSWSRSERSSLMRSQMFPFLCGSSGQRPGVVGRAPDVVECHAGRAALASAGRQCDWPVFAWPRRGDGPGRLKRPDGGRVAGQDAVELVARADVELGEDLAQVVLDRA